MARLMAFGVLALLSGATLVISAESGECSGDRCEGGSDSNILMQKRVEVYDERIISEDQMYTEDQMQSGAFDITLVSDDKLIAEDQMQADTYDIKDFEKFQADVEEIVRSKKRPAIQNMKKIETMVEAMLKELVVVHKTAQDELKSLKEDVKKANINALQAQQNIKSTIEVQVVGAEANHSTCRVAESPLNASKIGNCTKLTKFVTEIALPAIRPTSNDPAMMGPYLKAMKEYFCCQDGKDHPHCETKHGIFVKLDSKCTERTKAYDAHRKTCNAYQTRYEADFCEWRTKLTDECTAYLGTGGTYANALSAYDRKVAATQKLAGTAIEQQPSSTWKYGTSVWKTEYAGLKKIMCYVGVWTNDNNASTVDSAKLSACKEDINTSPMDVTYPKVACPVQCSTTPVENHPGTQGFVAAYAKFTQKAEAVMPCLKEVARGLPGGPAPTVATPAPAPAPTPAPELPVGFPSPSPFPGELPPLTLYDQNAKAVATYKMWPNTLCRPYDTGAIPGMDTFGKCKEYCDAKSDCGGFCWNPERAMSSTGYPDSASGKCIRFGRAATCNDPTKNSGAGHWDSFTKSTTASTTKGEEWKLLFCGHCGSGGTTWKTHPDLVGCEGHCQGMGKKLLIYNPKYKNCRCYEDGHCSSNKAASCGGGYVYKLSQAAPPTPAPPTPAPPTPAPRTPAPPTPAPAQAPAPTTKTDFTMMVTGHEDCGDGITSFGGKKCECCGGGKADKGFGSVDIGGMKVDKAVLEIKSSYCNGNQFMLTEVDFLAPDGSKLWKGLYKVAPSPNGGSLSTLTDGKYTGTAVWKCNQLPVKLEFELGGKSVKTVRLGTDWWSKRPKEVKVSIMEAQAAAPVTAVPIPQESVAAPPVPPSQQQSNAAPPVNEKCIEETYAF